MFDSGRWTTVGAALAILMACCAGPARAQMPDPRLWAADGDVNAVLRDGDRLYLGGAFEWVGPQSPGFVMCDAEVGTPRANLPRVDGVVYALLADGAGGWYLGGDFRKVSGVPRGHLAHVRADGTLDAWNPAADSTVLAMVRFGSTLYVGGRFSHVGGAARSRVAALHMGTGLALDWNPGTDGFVRCLAVGPDAVYAGGDFRNAGGQPRNYVAAFDRTSGALLDWSPTCFGSVLSLALAGGTLYAGGAFDRTWWSDPDYGDYYVATQALAKLDATSGARDTTFVRSPYTTPVYALAVDGNTLYVGGSFLQLGFAPRERLAAVDLVTGDVTPFAPGADGTVYGLAIRDGRVYAAGAFRRIGGAERDGLASLHSASGLATAWAPPVHGGASYCVAPDASSLAAGGAFTIVGGVRRSCLAALDLGTGIALDWNPAPDSTVHCLLKLGNTLRVGGAFHTIVGQPRAALASLDPESGEPTEWNPGQGGTVYAMLAHGASLFVGGTFQAMGGQVRYQVAEIDTSTGLATDWNTGPGQPLFGSVFTLASLGDTLLVGGRFSSVGGTPRENLAGFHLGTGQLTSWRADGGAPIYPAGIRGIVPLGPSNVIGGTSHAYSPGSGLLSSVDAVTGQLRPWSPAPNGSIDVLRRSGNLLYVLGGFDVTSSTKRGRGAVYLLSTGQLTPWDPAANGPLLALDLAGDTCYVGGRFSMVGGRAMSGIARLHPVPPGAPTVTLLSPTSAEIVPAGTTRAVRWDASAPGPGIESADLYWSSVGPDGPWSLIAAGCPPTGVHDWVVPYTEFDAVWLRVDVRDFQGAVASHTSPAPFAVRSVTGVPGGPAFAFALAAPAPNPARTGTARVSFALPAGGEVRLAVFDLQGREVRDLVRGPLAAGRHAVEIDTSGLRPGLYFVRLRAGARAAERRLVVIR